MLGLTFNTATLRTGTLVAGDDAVDVGFFRLDDLPPLAFDTDRGFLSSLA